MSNDLSSKHYQEMDFIRAIACMCVVLVHVTARHYHANEQVFNDISLFLNQIGRFGTPVFSLLSGFFLYRQVINRGFNFRSFFSSRFTKIVIPFIIWTFIYLIVRGYPFPWVEEGRTVIQMIQFILLGDAYYHLYFIIVILQFYLLFPILQLARSRNALIVLTVAGFLINYLYMRQSFDIGEGFINDFFRDRAFLLKWIFYFFLGGLMVHYWESVTVWVRKNGHVTFALGVVIVFFAIYEYNVFGRYSSTRVANLINIPVLFLALTGVYYFMDRFEKIRKFIMGIGNLSMGIYLVHPLVLYFIQTYSIGLLIQTRWLPLTFVITMGLSMLIVKIIYKMPFGQYVVTVAISKKKKDSVKSLKKYDVA